MIGMVQPAATSVTLPELPPTSGMLRLLIMKMMMCPTYSWVSGRFTQPTTRVLRPRYASTCVLHLSSPSLRLEFDVAHDEPAGHLAIPWPGEFSEGPWRFSSRRTHRVNLKSQTF